MRIFLGVDLGHTPLALAVHMYCSTLHRNPDVGARAFGSTGRLNNNRSHHGSLEHHFADLAELAGQLYCLSV